MVMVYSAYLRGWLGFVACMGLANTLQCYVDHTFFQKTLYCGRPGLVTSLTARLFGVWTLLSAILRMYCALDILNKGVYHLTLFSFVLAFLHFITELVLYRTVFLSVGVIVPIVVSGTSVVIMLVGYSYIDSEIQRTHKSK